MNFPKINIDACPPSDVGAGGMCQDSRCADPAFAAANPDLCQTSDNQKLILKPGSALLCDDNTATFVAYLSTAALGEVPLSSGVIFSSSDSSVMTIDGNTGAATVVGTGIVTITAAWNGLLAVSQMTVLGGSGDCCDDVGVRTVWVIDNSKSMGQTFILPGVSKGQVANKVLKNLIVSLDTTKNEAAIVSFNEGATDRADLTADRPTLQAARLATPWTTELATSIESGLSMAVTILNGATSTLGTLQKVIVLLTDGDNVPALEAAAREALLQMADEFKAAGGIIVCIGFRSAGSGFALLSQISSGGFFMNFYSGAISSGHSNSTYQDAITDLMDSLACLYCGTNRTSDYGYGCTADLPGPQSPDPSPLESNEASGGGGGGGGGGPLLPQLPCPEFTPDGGAVGGGGLNVALSVPGFPAARIRFCADGSQSPPNPSFANPVSNPLTGIDYDGAFVPIHLVHGTPGVHSNIKAIARLTGYADSPVCASLDYVAS